jgi:hypothetical protein
MELIGIPWRWKMGFIASCYAAIFALAAAMIGYRHFAALRNPNDFNGGMAAGGDLILEIGIGGLLLIPTFLLALVIRDREEMYTWFSKVLLGFSLTAPISLGLLHIPAVAQSDGFLGFFCMYRMFGAPVVMMWLATGRALARFRTAKRLTGWAVAIEAGTVVVAIALLFFAGKTGPGQ